MRVELQDKVALVTGAARRVGRVIALALAEQGVHILAHYNNADPAQVRDTLQAIKSFGVDAYAVQADFSQADAVDALFAGFQERFKQLDIVVNSAAVFQPRRLLDVSLEDWELTMAVNLRAPFLITQRAARLMLENPIPGGINRQYLRCRRRRTLEEVPASRHQQIRLVDVNTSQRHVACA